MRSYDPGQFFGLVVATLLALGPASGQTNEGKNVATKVEDVIDYRLPTSIFPSSYEILLALPDPAGSVFTGTVKINATSLVRTDEIIFHAGNISITRVQVFSETTEFRMKNKTADPVTEKYTVTLVKELSEGTPIMLVIEYEGRLRDDMIGFYRSSYIDDNGETKWLAATQFQATHARHAFPCFDEPNFKATFSIRINRPKKYQCISNMPLKASTPTFGTVWDEFETSPRMSTYLVAFVIADFRSLTNLKKNFSVWARPNAIDQAKYALKIGQQSLEVLSELFDYDYQLPKMDMVAVPDFAAGAMENWGLITYRETRMLYDESESSVMSQQDVASVIVHECVHMWFGNLVTPNWWGYLWLSEGFARYYQYMATAKIETTWNMEQQFVVEQLQTVFAADALNSSSPMTREVSSQAEIGTTGDTITYAKGASVIRMMELSFGSSVFNSALRQYLEYHMYSSAVPDELWSALQTQVNQYELKLGTSVATIMDTWTRQSGFPVLSVTIVNGVASLHQERFLLRNPESAATNRTWWIPITWTTQKNPDFLSTSPKFWFGKESAKVDVNITGDEWIVFNVQEAGFYRVNYDRNSWYRIINVLMSDRFQEIHVVNRAAIVDDLLNLARAGYLDYDTALTGFNYIKRETNYLPFKAAFTGLDYIIRRFEGQDSYHLLSNYALSLLDYIYNDVGYNDHNADDRLTVLLRKELNGWACNFDQPECIENSLIFFSNWRNKSEPVPKNQRAAAYCTAVKYGNQEDWNFLWKKYSESNCASEQLVILKALGCSRDKTILENYLLSALMTFEESRIRKQDSTSVFSAVYGSGIFGAEYILDFVEKHHAVIAEYHGGYDAVASILSGASQRLSTEKHIKKFTVLVDSLSVKFPSISKSLKKSLDLAKYELQWFKDNEVAVITWIMKNNKGEATSTPSTLTSTPSTLTITPSTPTSTPSTPSSTPSTPTSTPNTPPSTPSTPTSTPSTPTSTSSTPPSTPSTPPSTPSTPPSTPSTLTSTPSTLTSTPSTPTSTPSTPTSTPSTPTSTPSTPTSTSSTPTSTPSTLTSTPNTPPSTPSTPLSTPSTLTSTPSTPTSTPSTPISTPSTPSTPTSTPSTPTTTENSSADTSTTTDYRLPTSIVPKSYRINLTPYIEPGNFTFDGTVHITAIVAETTKKIVLHINEITISAITLKANGAHLKLVGKEENAQYQFLTLTLATSLLAGDTLEIEIIYTGLLNTAMRGFYRSSYIDAAGKTRWLAATHLEPVGARKMFPCFDEPALKATFIVSVTGPADYIAVSNTPLQSFQHLGVDRILSTFEETPVMSTYLVALIVSDFATLNDAENSCATWARPNAIQQAKYALSVMAPLVKFFEKAVNHRYQLPKLDMFALPDFASGAMENWGLLTYKESNMLYDPNHSPITSKQSIADVISHEISHQWFGDQVSPRWWKFLWLSEGFARYFQYHGTAHVETEWGLESQFVVEQLHSAFGSDALDSTHPMTHDVYSPSEISGIFDAISYAKAASVLRMVEKTFGTALFYDALHEYLTARNRTDATPEHLFEAFQHQVDERGMTLETSVKTIMDTWTTQGGYPVVNVSIAAGVASLSQEQFLIRNPKNVAINKIWWVPVTWASKSSPDFTNTSAKYWLSKDKGSVTLSSTDEWVIFNVQQSGYYRVNYDSATWKRLINVLKSTESDKIHEVNRASLIDDLLNLGRAGYVDYATVLSATQYLSKETNYIPWRAAFNGLAYLNQKLAGKDIYELYKTHILTILKPAYNRLGFTELAKESHFDKLMRRYVVNWACEFGLKDYVSLSLKYFADWKANPSTKLVPVNLRNTIYCTGIKHGSVDDWEFLWKQYTSASVTTEKVVILSALGCSNNTEILHKFLMKAITKDSEIRFQDSTSVFSSVYSSGLFGAECALEFVELHYKEMFDYYSDYTNIGSILSAVSSRFSTKELVMKFEKFVEAHDSNLAAIKNTLETSLTRAHEELKWYDSYSPRIYEWLDKTYPSEDYRLPKKISPTFYDIYLTPYLDESNFTFDGEVKMDMEVHENTSSIVLLANELTIKEVIVWIDSVNLLTVSSWSLNTTTHKFTIYLTTIVSAGSKLSANIKYTGILNDKMRGFYRSSYYDETGKTRWLASTQFQPVHARQAFPCFDEPAFKAKFIVNIERPNDYHTRSNMPLSNSVSSERTNWTWDSYEETKIMSSYLLAFVVSDFSALENDAKNFTLWARPQAVQHGAYALSVGQKALGFLEIFTGIEYPIRKMDLVAVPDFAAGAMENWGLVTFREYGLLYHENVTSALYKRYLTTTVTHELVHMWFGDLVTCQWWDYIWLHEGFAQYLQWIISDAIEPHWNLPQQFVVYELQVAMETDGSPTIHPMNNQVSKPLDISNSFDKVAYGKSGSVIRMMHHSFGPKVFEPALHSYLDANKYDNAQSDDLWSAIQLHEDRENSLGNLSVSVKTLMDSWANQAGYPVVNATWRSGQLVLGQQRFLLSQPKEPTTDPSKEFWIPITLTTKTKSNFTDTRPSFWFGTKQHTVPLSLKGDEWFILNIQQVGYYRVNYDKSLWDRLTMALRSENFDGIHEINRAQIVDDLLNLARTDHVEYDTALWTMKYLAQEENHLPWKAFFNGVTFLNQRFAGHGIAEDFAGFVLGLMERIYEKVGFTDVRDDDQLGQLNRQLILSWACKFGHSACMETSRRLFDEWRKDKQQWISPNARPAVYCSSLRDGTYEDWDFLWNQYEKTDFSSDKVVILNALGCTRNTTTLNTFMKRAISSDNAIRDQDVASVFSSVYSADQFGVDAALDFLVNNYNDVYKYYGSWSNVAGLFSNVAGRISTQKQIDKLESFANKSATEVPEMRKSLQSSVEVANDNLQWFALHSETIHIWLSKAPGEGTTTTKPGGNGNGSTDPNASGISRHSVCLLIAAFYLVIAY